MSRDKKTDTNRKEKSQRIRERKKKVGKIELAWFILREVKPHK